MKLLLGMLMMVASINAFSACAVSSVGECTTDKTCNALNTGSPAVVKWDGGKCVAITASETASNCGDVFSAGTTNTAPARQEDGKAGSTTGAGGVGK